MKNIPKDLCYTKTHEWVKKEDNNIVTVGITDHAQHQLGELVYVELPAIKKQIKAGDEVAVVESVKTAADVYSPVDGEIIAINEQLSSAPSQVNQDPYGNGWLFKVKTLNPKCENLLAAQAYEKTIE